MRRDDRPRMQRVRESFEQIVGVQRLTSDVSAGALVRQRAADDRHALDSIQNFSTRLFDTSRRYSLDPR